MLKIDKKEGVFEFRHEAMATDLSLSLGGVDRDYARQAAQAFFQRVDEVEGKLSLYQESSDVTRFNRLQEGESVRVSSECVQCLELALQASVLTEGRFHVLVGSQALKAKGGSPPFLRALLAGENEPEAESAEAPPGMAIEVDAAQRWVRRVSSGALLDFGGIGKGFALDLAMEELEDWEVPLALANFGGSTLLFRGDDPAEAWHGSLGERALQPFVRGAISSSGLGFQGEHIVDPSPGAQGCRWERSYARCASAGLADALSTGAMLMEAKAMEAAMEREPGLVFAAYRDGGFWGAQRFCNWDG